MNMSRSMVLLLFVTGDLLEVRLHIKKLFLQGLKSRFHYLIRLDSFMKGLHLDLQQILKRMGHAIAREFDILVLEKVDSEKISQGVVLEGDIIGGTVFHLLAELHIDQLLLFFLLVVLAELQPKVLTHLIYMNCLFNWGNFNYSNNHNIKSYPRD